LDRKRLVDTVVEAGLREQVNVMIAGANVTESFSEKIDSDRHAHDAILAPDVVRELIGGPA
jgi:methanogenic corrinoid protein MtbC1